MIYHDSSMHQFQDIGLLSFSDVVVADEGLVDLELFTGSLDGCCSVRLIGSGESPFAVLRDVFSAGFRRVHILAHGEPGAVQFGGRMVRLGDFVGALQGVADRVEHRSLHFWSCLTGAGAEGRAFVQGLSRLTGGMVSAFSGLVGSKALGGGWTPDVFAGAMQPVSVPFAGAEAYRHTLSIEVPAPGTVMILGHGDIYGSIGAALAAAVDGETIVVGSGQYTEDITITKSVTLLGANNGSTAVVNDSDGNPIPDVTDNVRAYSESWIDGTVTVASDNVEINGFRLHNIDGPLKFDNTVLTDGNPATTLDNLTLVNNFITGFYAGNAPALGTQGESVQNATGWNISQNFIGGVITDSTHNGSGSLYISGLADSAISDNVFWRSAAAHLYLSSLTNVSVDGNNFYHGIHASGADFDGYAEQFYGTGYSSGYGTGYGYGYGDTGSGVYFGRNYWLELKGVNTGVSISGNQGSYNSGGIQLYGETAGSSFSHIVISGNTFKDFVNADPNGMLTDKQSRHWSGLMGAIDVSINSGATASDILIQGNSVTIGADQVYSAFDVSGQVQVTGHVTGLVVQNNILNWLASENINYHGITVPSTTYFNTPGRVLEGIGLYAGLDGNVDISGNGISFLTSIATGAGIFISKDLSTPGYGIYAAATHVAGDNVITRPAGTALTDIVLENFSGVIPSDFTVNIIEGDATPLRIYKEGAPGSYILVPITYVDGGSLMLPYILHILGTAGNDSLHGYGGTDSVTGLGANDILDGGAGNDTMDGGLGNDTYIVDSAGDVIIENSDEGTDTVQSSVTWTLGANFENLTLTGTAGINGVGNSVANTLIGNSGDNSLQGEGGNDTLQGGAGNDTLDGGDGNDSMAGGLGNDTYVVGSASDVVTESSSAGTDTVESGITYTLGANVENLTLTGSDNSNGTGNTLANVLIGNDGNNILTGLAGNDTLTGGAGDDTLDGGAGTDSMDGGEGSDRYVVALAGDHAVAEFSDSGASGTDEVRFTSTTASTLTLFAGDTGIEKVVIGTGTDPVAVTTGTTALNVNASAVSSALWIIGNDGANSLTGTVGDDTLEGGKGNDTLTGGAGNDSMAGGDGNDLYVVDSTSDDVTDSAGTDTVQSSSTYTLEDKVNIENLTLTGSAAIDGTGNSVANVLIGNDGNNTLSGLAGNDTLTGGAGNDILDGGAGTDSMDGGEGSDRYVVALSGDHAVAEFSDSGASGTDEVRFTSTAASTLTLFAGDTGIEKVVVGTGTDPDAVTTGTTALNVNASAVSSALWIIGNDGANSLTGTVGDDSLEGGKGNDTLTGGSGNDSMAGGDGNDLYVVESAGDVVTELVTAGTDTVQSSITYTLEDKVNIEHLTLTGSAAIDGTGNSVANLLIGNDGNNILTGLAGNDSLTGGAGNDTLDGGDGNDSMTGGQGNDTYVVGSTIDVVTESSSAGTDTVESSITYTLGANVENLALSGSDDINGTGNTLANVMIGNSGNNILTGLAGNDTLDGGAGNDILEGGAGNDTYVVDSAGDFVTESASAGTDTVQSSITYTLADKTNIENLILTGSEAVNGTGRTILASLLIGNSGDNILTGGSGNDTIDGGGGNDTLIGGGGNDTYILHGGEIIDNSSGGPVTVQSSVTYTLGDGIQNLTLTGSDNIDGTGNTLANVLIGNSGDNRLSGLGGSDTLNGGAGNDTLDGGDGNDSMAGALGNDTYVVNSTSDVVTEAASAGTDTVESGITYTLGANVENLTLTGSDNINGTGNTLANLLIGNDGNNILTGLAGNDTLDGGVGNDNMIGGAGDDTYVVDSALDDVTESASAGTDTVQSSITYTLGDNVENLTLTGSDNIDGTGNTLANLLVGNDGSNNLSGDIGNDTLIGGEGNDTLLGGLGNDTYVVDSLSDVITDSAGTDSVQSSITYTLVDNVNIENLTLTGSAAIDGTGNSVVNVLTGNDGDNRLSGLGGNDTLNGGAGNDTLDGGDGNDSMAGGLGNDTYVVGSTIDVVTESSSAGTDTVESSITYTLGANIEKLSLMGTSPVNGTGNTLDNLLIGNDHNNILSGLAGNDTIQGGLGNDNLDGGIGNDSVDGEADNDTVAGGVGNDTLTGGAGDDILDGGAGNDSIDGGEGSDRYVVALAGDHTAAEFSDSGASGTDEVRFTSTAAGTLTLFAGDTGIENVVIGTGTAPLAVTTATTALNVNASLVASALSITGNAGANSLTGTGSADTLDGGGGNDTLIGGDGNDTLLGGLGNDSLSGGLGDDSMAGGDGNDMYVVDSTSDVVTDSAGTDTVQSSVDWTLEPTNVENLTLLGTALIGTGNTLANVLIGNSGDNILSGLGGNDTLDGGAGNDSLDGGDGNDSMTGGLGNDTYVVGSASDVVTEAASAGTDTVESSITYTLGANVENLTLMGTSPVNGTGNTLANLLIGNDLSNILSGLAGNDTLTGGLGNDILDGGAGNDSMDGEAASDLYIVALAGDHTAAEFSDSGASGTDEVRFTSTAASTLTLFAGDTGIESVVIGTGTGVAVTTATTALNVNASAVTTALSIIGNAGANSLTGTGSADTLDGGGGNDTLIGGDGNDTLLGGLGNDSLSGGLGDDSMVGGDGNDMYVVDSASDVMTDSAGTDTVQSSITYTLEDNIENLTMTGSDAVDGTGNTLTNVMIGNDLNNILSGLAGNDSLIGGGGDDSLIGGVDNDTLDGGAGNDTLDGGSGIDRMAGGAGNDIYVVNSSSDVVTESASAGTDTVQSVVTYTLGANVENLTLILAGTATINGTGNTLSNVLIGNDGNNLLSGLAGNDTIQGGAGNDTLDGGAGNDSLDGGLGNDSMVGGAGDDIYVRDSSSDVVTESASAGTDTVQSSLDYTLLANFENLTLTGTALIGTGNTLANMLIGNDGNNMLTGLAGNDTIQGGAGKDTLYGGDGNDSLDGGLGSDSLEGGAGNDIYVVNSTSDDVTDSAGTDTVQSSATYTLGNDIENLTLTGSDAVDGTGNTLTNVMIGNSGDNILSGLGGNDTLDGGAGNDSLDGGDGNDRMTGGLGDDTYVVGSISDVVTELPSAGTDTVESSITYTLGVNVENLRLAGTAPINGIGNTLANLLIGNDGINILTGLAGNDTLTGGAGNDLLDGGAGNDSMNGGEGSDLYIVGLVGDHAFAEFADSGASGTDEVRFISTAATTLTLFAGDTGIENVVIGTGTALVAVTTGTAALNVNASAVLNALSITGNNGVNTLTGTAYHDSIYGGAGNDALIGGGGDDTLIGGNGNDSLTGGAGSDHFVFDFVPGATNRDTITDFVTGEDDLQFSKTVFSGLGAVGGLTTQEFWSNSTGAAHDLDDRIIYNTSTGALYYDADGTGAIAAVQVAIIGTSTHPALAYTDIHIIA